MDYSSEERLTIFGTVVLAGGLAVCGQLVTWHLRVASLEWLADIGTGLLGVWVGTVVRDVARERDERVEALRLHHRQRRMRTTTGRLP